MKSEHQLLRSRPGLLHRPSPAATQGQPSHRRRIPRHLPPAPAIRRRATGEGPFKAVPRGIWTRPSSATSSITSRRSAGSPRRSRNTRLAAIHSFFQYVSFQEPAHADQCRRILAIPSKRYERRLIEYLTAEEIDALLAAPDRTTWIGRRDRALLLVGIQTGLRVSELIGLRRDDVVLGTGAHVRCEGKGRKERCTPLRQEVVEVLAQWLRECPAEPATPAFPSSRGGPLSRDAVERLVARHQRSAEGRCPSLKRKRVTPHVLRHTAAMQLLRHGIDRSVIALWLGHESVETTADVSPCRPAAEGRGSRQGDAVGPAAGAVPA